MSGVSHDIQQQFYTADPLASVPLVATSVSPAAGRSFPALGSTGPFAITFQHTAVDKNHVVLIRDSGSFSPAGQPDAVDLLRQLARPGGAGARERDQGRLRQGSRAQHAPGLLRPGAALVGEPVGLRPARAGSARPRSRRASKTGSSARRTTGPNPPDGDQRYAYIILTGFGRTGRAANNDWLPVEGLLRVYVTGWDEAAAAAARRTAATTTTRRAATTRKGAQLWGHLVEPITIDPAVIVGDGECDLTNDNIQCSPRLVR